MYGRKNFIAGLGLAAFAAISLAACAEVTAGFQTILDAKARFDQATVEGTQQAIDTYCLAKPPAEREALRAAVNAGRANTIAIECATAAAPPPALPPAPGGAPPAAPPAAAGAG